MATPVTYQHADKLYDESALTFEGAPLGLYGWVGDLLPQFYTPFAAFGFAHLCTVGNSETAPFLGILDTSDGDFFDERGPETTHTLRYVANTQIKAGALLYVDGAQYTVTHTPKRINREEMRARLILNP